jgi:hypothetical protein
VLRKVIVAVALELAPLEDKTPFPHSRIRPVTIPDSSAESIAAFVCANMKIGAMLFTDGHRSYRGLTEYNLDPWWRGKRLPLTERIFWSMNKWFKVDTLDRVAVDRGLEYVRAEFAPENPRFYRHVTFEDPASTGSATRTRWQKAIEHENPPQRRPGGPSQVAA